VRLHPNPPRLVTVGLALALGIVGIVYAWPIDPLVSAFGPLGDLAAQLGIVLNREIGYLGLFASSSLLVAGSLLPGI